MIFLKKYKLFLSSFLALSIISIQAGDNKNAWVPYIAGAIIVPAATYVLWSPVKFCAKKGLNLVSRKKILEEVVVEKNDLLVKDIGKKEIKNKNIEKNKFIFGTFSEKAKWIKSGIKNLFNKKISIKNFKEEIIIPV